MDTLKDIDLEKIQVINRINKRLKEDFIINNEFDLLTLINDYGLDFILDDLSILIKKINNIN